MNQELIDYIEKSKEKGVSNEDIKKALLDAGWREDDVNAVLRSTIKTSQKSPIPTPKPLASSKISSDMQHLHPRTVWLFFFRYSSGFIIGLLFLSTWIFPVASNYFKKISYIIMAEIIIIILFLCINYIFARLTYHFWRYQLTENAYKAERGVIFKRYVSIPYERIQNVDIYRGILDRIMGLSDLQIQTAGYTAAGPRGIGRGFSSEGRLPGLHRQRAEEIREELIKKAKGNKSGM